MTSHHGNVKKGGTGVEKKKVIYTWTNEVSGVSLVQV